MKRKNRFLALLLGVILVLSFGMMAACGEGNGNKDNDKDKDNDGDQSSTTQKGEVKSVGIKYQGQTVDGSLLIDLSLGTLELEAAVTADENAEYTVEWTSGDPDVATVAGQGDRATVTLNGGGETAIKAAAGGKSAQFILTVEDDTAAQEYTITVVGGVAKDGSGQNVTKAAAGTVITLQADVVPHKTFSSWTISPESVSLAGGVTFMMPAENVTATAVFTDTLYELTLTGATIKSVDKGEVPQPEDGGDTSGNAERQISLYRVAYGTQVTIKANATSSDRVFVGFDYLIENNRVGETGVEEYTFTMDDTENASYTAIYSPFSKSVWNVTEEAGDNGGHGIVDTAANFYNKEHGSKLISSTDGDADLKGLTGYRLSINGTEKATSGMTENIQGSQYSLNNGKGRGMAKVILKNYSSTRTVALELCASFCGIRSLSGTIEVGPNETVEHNFIVNFGFSNTWWGVALRKDIGGNSDEYVNVDMVMGMASELYPSGDPYIDAGRDAQLVTFANAETFGPSWKSGNEPCVIKDFTKNYLMLASWGASFGAADAGRWTRIQIQNMPMCTEESGTTTIYGRVINLAQNLTTDARAEYRIVIGTNADDPTQDSQSAPIHFERTGDTVTFKLDIPRTMGDGNFYIFIVKPVLEDATVEYGYGFVMHLTYNNVFGYEEA